MKTDPKIGNRCKTAVGNLSSWTRYCLVKRRCSENHAVGPGVAEYVVWIEPLANRAKLRQVGIQRIKLVPVQWTVFAPVRTSAEQPGHASGHEVREAKEAGALAWTVVADETNRIPVFACAAGH